MRPGPFPIEGTIVSRRYISETQEVVLVGRNVVLRNEIGFYHTVSLDDFMSEYRVSP